MKPWLLLIHNIPPRPLYLRAKIRQRLERIGAVALKNSVYALPESDDALEDLQWLAGEIAAGGGHAFIVAGKLVSGMTEKELVAAFRAARTSDYDALLRDMRAAPDALAKHRARLAEIRTIDFFRSPKRKEAEQMLAKLERKQPKPRRLQPRDRPAARGTWITRKGIKIDRIASA
ncbi:MAG TPA: Chromate resistance protein ChrB, partial [Thermoanaerobaculia bacterium]|nr:Chromate resistance protein ChrB [Thermoanaerobaculia bacterium]